MSKPFKFRYVNEITGVFVLLIVVVLVISVILAGRAQGWFVPVHNLTTRFPVEGTMGLQEGSEIVILGKSVGSVDKIIISDDGHMEAKLAVKGDFIRFVRSDSHAMLKKKFGVAGDAFIEITKGTGAELQGEEPYIEFRKDTEITEQLEASLEQVRGALEEYTGLASDVRDPEGHVQQLLKNLEELSAAINAGEGAVGSMLRNPQVQADIENIISGLTKVVEDVQSIVNQVKKETTNLSGVSVMTQEALHEATKLMEAVQRHWLIRKYTVPESPVERISPLDITISEDPR